MSIEEKSDLCLVHRRKKPRIRGQQIDASIRKGNPAYNGQVSGAQLPLRARIACQQVGRLEIREGFLFGRTVRRRICQYKPYPLIDAAAAAVDIAPSSAQGELRFRDPRNKEDDILYLDTDTSSDGYPWFLHGAIGIKPQFINMYLRQPEAKEIPGKFPNLNAIKPSAGEDLGYINELNSPYDEPTDWTEIVIPPKMHIGAEYYNKDSVRSHQPVLNILFSVYWVKFFSKAQNPVVVRRIANREVPATFLTVGFGDTPVDLGNELKKDWQVQPMSLEDAST